jgi:hypothetical protein
MMANVEPMVKTPMKTNYMSATCLSLHTSYFTNLPNMPMRNGRHLVRSASRNKKKPMESLIKLYAAMMKIE